MTTDAHGEALELGAVVEDVEDDPVTRDQAVVVAHPNVPADEWVAYRTRDGEVTVADDNPGYPRDVPVTVVAFKDDLAEAHSDYTGGRALPLGDLATYAFPPSRLVVVEQLGDDTDTAAPPVELAELRDRLATSATTDVVFPTDGPAAVLEVEKLGETYRIHPNGEIRGDGALRDRLDALARDYLTTTGGEA